MIQPNAMGIFGAVSCDGRLGGFYPFTVALQLGSVNDAVAALVIEETVVPGVIGVVLLGDTAQPGQLWLAGVAFAGAVVGAVAVAMFVAVEQAHSGEGRHRLELGGGRPTVYRHRTHRF